MLSAAMLTTSSSTMAGPTKSEPLEQEESVGRRKSARASSTGPADDHDRAVRRQGDVRGAGESVHRAEAVALGVDEGQPAEIGGVAAEDPERVLARAGGVEMEAESVVVAHRESGDAGDAVGSAHAVAHDLRGRSGVPSERRSRVKTAIALSPEPAT